MSRRHREPGALRLVTYNIHKCRGMDGRIVPRRIARVLRDIDADVIGLQEVVRSPAHTEEADQLLYLAGELGLPHWAFGETRKWRGSPYGNAVLSRWPIARWENHNVTWRGREQRACLQVNLEIADHARPLHIFNAHLGTAFLERRAQGRLLLGPRILNSKTLSGPRVMLGDFNEWTHGLCSRMLCGELERIKLEPLLGRARTYPGVLPLLLLDQIYYDRGLKLTHFTLHRSRAALLASDHLPLSADFALPLAAPAAQSIFRAAAEESLQPHG